MSDEQPPSRNAPRKRWVDRISQLFSGEPHDLDDLLGILQEARESRLLDTDALSMIEGVLQVSKMRVRDIMNGKLRREEGGAGGKAEMLKTEMLKLKQAKTEKLTC